MEKTFLPDLCAFEKRDNTFKKRKFRNRFWGGWAKFKDGPGRGLAVSCWKEKITASQNKSCRS